MDGQPDARPSGRLRGRGRRDLSELALDYLSSTGATSSSNRGRRRAGAGGLGITTDGKPVLSGIAPGTLSPSTPGPTSSQTSSHGCSCAAAGGLRRRTRAHRCRRVWPRACASVVSSTGLETSWPTCPRPPAQIKAEYWKLFDGSTPTPATPPSTRCAPAHRGLRHPLREDLSGRGEVPDDRRHIAHRLPRFPKEHWPRIRHSNSYLLTGYGRIARPRREFPPFGCRWGSSWSRSST